MRKLADSIPTEKEGVFGYDISWAMYDHHKLGGAETPLTKFVKKKVVELLGSEEEYVISYILEKLAAHATAQEMLDELTDLFEDKSETFVLKLYRMVIFETQKAELLASEGNS
jgi:RNA-binding protein 25